jgi:hypothetical protein
MMGVGAIGSLSLALAFAYFGGEALSTIALFGTGIGTSLQYVALTGQIIVGLAFVHTHSPHDSQEDGASKERRAVEALGGVQDGAGG